MRKVVKRQAGHTGHAEKIEHLPQIPGYEIMAGWKELLLDTLQLMDEVKRLNRDVERLTEHVVAVDKRLVRLETIIEIQKSQP